MQPTFSLTQIFSASLSIMARYYVYLIAVVVGFVLIQQVLSTLGPLVLPNPVGDIVVAASDIMIATFLQIIAILFTALVHGGQPMDLRQLMKTALARLPIVMLFVIAALFAVALGSFFLLIPGLFLATIWAVAGPALTLERQGIMSAFARSRRLTKGHRWRVLLLVLALWCVIPAVLVLPAAMVVSGSFALDALSDPGPLATVVVNIGGAIAGVLVGVVTTVAYFALAAAKQGEVDGDLVTAFQ